MTAFIKVLKGIWNIVAFISGLVFGTIAGWIYLGIIMLVNTNKKRIKLSPALQKTLNHYYPSIDLNKVKITVKSFGILPGKKGLTQSYNIFCKYDFYENKIDELKLLLHELVHVKQYREYGKAKFYILYAYGYINNMFSYPDIPIEKEAFDYAGSISDSFLSDYKRETKGRRDDVTKRRCDEETKGRKDEETKGLRDERTKRFRIEGTERLKN